MAIHTSARILPLVGSTQTNILLGIDIGGTRIKAVALKTPFEGDFAIPPYECPSHAQDGPQTVIETVLQTLKHFTAQGLNPVRLGIGCAGSVEPTTGVVRNSPNFADWKNIPLKAELEERSKIPTRVSNDANCAVIAEWKAGSAKGARNVVLLTLGTGIGGGLILNNQLFEGSTGTGGELGHFSISSQGIPCPCGNRGCFERYCSASALRGRAGNLTARDIFANENDPHCKTLVTEFLDHFKVGLTSLANVFDPDIIVISGGVSKGIAHHFPMLKAWLEQHAFPAVGPHVKLATARFDNLSGAVGAALLAE